MKRFTTSAIAVLMAALFAAIWASCALAGGSYNSCSRTTSQGAWGSYTGGQCGTFWIGWGSNGTDRCRWSTSSAGVGRDMYLTYRHIFTKRSNGDTSADHWSYAEGSYSGNVACNQQGSGAYEHTVNTRASYNWDDWLEIGSDGGGSMDTVADMAKFYPELDAVYAGKSVESYMYAGNVYQWRYLMSNPSSAWWSWGNGVRFAHTGGVTEGPGWYAAGRVNDNPGTAPGGTMDLYFNMRPTTTGDYNEDFQMVSEGVSWFGDKVSSNGNMRTWTRLSRKAPGATDGWDSGSKKKGQTVRFYIAGADSWGTGSSYSWDWDGSTSQGWYAGNACTVTQEDANDRLRINITGSDPFCYSSGGLAINASTCRYLTIRMWSNGGTTAQLFWSSSAGGWSEERHVDWNIIADSQWHVYRVQLPASWSGTVYQIRLDPVGAGAASGQTVYVDWLRIHHVSDGMSAKIWLGTSNNNWDIYNSSDMSWDSSANAWYKDFTITGNYPQTYYCAMHVYNNNSQHCDNDSDRKYGDNYRTYYMANTAPVVTNANYNDDSWYLDNTPTLQWNYSDADSNPQTKYRVQVDDNSDFSSPAIDTGEVSSSANNYTTAPLGDGRWYWRVMACDTDWSNWSVGTSFRIDATGPTTPTIISVVPTNSQNQDVVVTFGGSTDALNEPVTYQIKLDSGYYSTYTPATSPKTFSAPLIPDGDRTVYVKAFDALGNPSAEATAPFTMTHDGIPPTVSNITVTAENVGDPPANNCLQGKLWIDAEVTDTGGSGLASVQIKLDDGDYATMPAKVGGDPEDYEMEYTIDASWTNGTHTVTIKATDGAGNSTTTDAVEFKVNKNTVSGFVGLQNFTWVLKNRDVAFGLNGTTVRIVTLSFINGISAYTLTDVPDMTSISAKTAWSLRKLITGLSAPDGQYEANFTGSNTVLGGDLNGDNVVNALDYSILRGAWGTGSAGDINGDGYTDNADYLIMKANWYRKGDPQ